MTRNTSRGIILGLAATLAGAALSPAAMADSRQSNKNNWRNLGYAGAAVAGYGLLKHNRTATVLGAAGAGYGAYRYEQDRHSQDQNQRARQRYFYRHNYGNSTTYYRHSPRGNAYGYYRHRAR